MVRTRFPSNVLTGVEPDCGATWFNLNALVKEYEKDDLTVVAADFYHSNSIMRLSDDEIGAKVLRELKRCEPAVFGDARIVDQCVLRFPAAVTHFSPGSYAYRPTQDKTPFKNFFMAGDWCKQVPHGANGLSQERAYVTGLRAANLVMDALNDPGPRAHIEDVTPDEPHVGIPKEILRNLRMGV